MSFEVTQRAAEQVRQALTNRQHGLGLRVGIKTSGCSGLAYVLEYVDTPNTEDLLHTSNGVNLYIDPKSQVYLEGTVLDFEDDGIQCGFTFKNPNEKARCGCGESFIV